MRFEDFKKEHVKKMKARVEEHFAGIMSDNFIGGVVTFFGKLLEQSMDKAYQQGKQAKK